MNKKLKQLIIKHINIVKSMYPEVYIEVDMIGDDILVGIDSLDISDEERYEDLMVNFIREYHSKGFLNVYWGVNDTLTCDNLSLLENSDKIPSVINF
ncbi:MAG: hypothetical protein FWF73_07105 [Spirochaetes bacterium]|nr:hypothetical protein [Spirochaetota bacterium]